MSKLIYLTTCTKFELNSLRDNDIEVKSRLQTLLAVATQ